MECKKCVYQLLRSIGYCHSNNVPPPRPPFPLRARRGRADPVLCLQIIHRDIKPENLLLSKHGILKLCDFGFARPLGGPGARYTDYVATRWYRSPELLVGDTQYGRGVDVWAIGCMLAEIHTGLPLFPGESDIDQLFHILRCQGNLTEHLSDCLRKNPLFEGVDIPHIREPETLKRRFPRFGADMIQFMSACLGNDPKSRASCADLLEQPYFDGFHDWWAKEFKRLCEKDGIGGRARYKKRTKKPQAGGGGGGGGGDVNEADLEARRKLDDKRKAMEDERQAQIKSLKNFSLEIPAFNPNKNKEKKEQERKERREREEREQAREQERQREKEKEKEKERQRKREAKAEREEKEREQEREREREREQERQQRERERERAQAQAGDDDVHGQNLGDYDATSGNGQEAAGEGLLPNCTGPLCSTRPLLCDCV